MPRVAIIDYGLCNLDSIRRAVELCGGKPFVTAEAEPARSADLIILPGVGAFGAAMKNLRAKHMDDLLRERIGSGTPLLGICLGMQLLASVSSEGGECAGLNLVPGKVTLLDGARYGERVPHMGWNEVVFARPEELLFKGIPSGKNFYFVHSYCFQPEDPNWSVASTPYCGQFTSVIRRNNIFGTQFHPEKSQWVGFKLLTNFLSQ